MKKMLVALALCAAIGVQAAIIWPRNVFTNPDFEVGTLTGWDATYAPSAAVVGSTAHFIPYPDPLALNTRFTSISAPTGSGSGDQRIFQTVTLNAGDTIQGWYGWRQDGGVPGQAAVEVYDALYNLAAVPFTTTSSSWTTWSFTAPSTGAFAFHFGAKKTAFGAGTVGYAVFDMSAVPEPRSWLMGGALLGMLGVGEFIRRRRLQKQPTA